VDRIEMRHGRGELYQIVAIHAEISKAGR